MVLGVSEKPRVGLGQGSIEVPVSIAPMMDRTDRHYRYFMRQITPGTLFYTEMVTAQAILHGDAVREGLDYRGVHVFSASHHVTGVPWFVVAKTDVSALMAPIWDKTLSLALAVLAIILVTVFMVLLLWRGQRASYLSFRDLQIEERAALAKHFEELVRFARTQGKTTEAADH